MYRETAPPAVRTRAEAGKPEEQPLPRTKGSGSARALCAGPAGRAVLSKSGETRALRTDRLHFVGRKRQHHPAAPTATPPMHPRVQEFTELLHPGRRRVAHRFGVARRTCALSCNPHVPPCVEHSNKLPIFIELATLHFPQNTPRAKSGAGGADENTAFCKRTRYRGRERASSSAGIVC